MAKAKAAAIEDIDEDEAEEGAQQPKKKLFALPPLKYLLVGGAVLLLLGGGGGAAYYFFMPRGEPKVAAVPAAKPAVFVDLPEVLVNLSGTGSNDRTQYLKLKIVLELPDQLMIQQIQPIMPRVMDAFQTYLRELRPGDLDGSAGLYRLKEELTRRVNASIAPSRVNAVLFKEIVVQ
jgi:flagellar protein FliL